MPQEAPPSMLGPYDFSALEAFFEEKNGRRTPDGKLTLRVNDVRDQLTARGSLLARRSVENLQRLGCIEQVPGSNPQAHYMVTPTGERFYRRFIRAGLNEVLGVDASSWTGIVSPTEVRHVLAIVADIEDIARTIPDNEKQSQIIGLVTALTAILQTPAPPRQPILSIVRDPAFAHIVEVGGLLLLIATFLKT